VPEVELEGVLVGSKDWGHWWIDIRGRMHMCYDRGSCSDCYVLRL
jgi:hypothetical protein